MQTGARAYLVKPNDLDKLVETIGQLIRSATVAVAESEHK
jgi:DNA-binding response OmpR family regulator